MIRATHILSALLWFCNAGMWAFYSHVPAMAVASLGAAIASLLIARGES